MYIPQPSQWPGYNQWHTTFGGSLDDYRSWLNSNGYSSAKEFADSLSAGGSLGNQAGGPNLGNMPGPNVSQIPVPGQSTPGALPVPIAPPPSIPSPSGAPSFAPPQVQMPAMMANPRVQGLGGMPLIRDRMMASTMAPFAGPNWGVPQVNPAYLTQQMRLPGGAIPADAMISQAPVLGLGGPGAEQLPIGLGGMRIPRQPMVGMGTA